MLIISIFSAVGRFKVNAKMVETKIRASIFPTATVLIMAATLIVSKIYGIYNTYFLPKV